MLINLPRMTPDLVANILAWRSTNTSSQNVGAETDTYMRMNPPYQCKNAPFETVDELRLVYEMDMDTLYGEDANLNGILDPNENDGDTTPPTDNQDGQLNPGLLEYLTVYTLEPVNASNGTPRFDITTYSTSTKSQLQAILVTNGIATARATQILNAADTAVTRTPFTCPLAFFYASGMTTQEFMQVEQSIRGKTLAGLVNVNTASDAVLACLPGLTNGQSDQLVAYRQANTNTMQLNPSMIWITQVLQQSDALAAGPYISGFGYQFLADVAAIGHNGRGYRRTRYIFDTSQVTPVILHRQDLSQLGWALGKEVREKYLMAKTTP
jgi:DNA uptake protein ComE-like DNA-binding protein